MTCPEQSTFLTRFSVNEKGQEAVTGERGRREKERE